jgi:hypothetical protein
MDCIPPPRAGVSWQGCRPHIAERFADGNATEQERATFSGGRYFESKVLSNSLMSAIGAVGRAVARPMTVTEAGYCQSSVNESYVHAAAEKRTWDDIEYYESAARPLEEYTTNIHSALLREILGPLPFRPVTIDPRWLTSTVIDLGQAICDERAFDRLPILADALMDAGCASEETIAHCRGPGLHVRGCWVVDKLLGKE